MRHVDIRNISKTKSVVVVIPSIGSPSLIPLGADDPFGISGWLMSGPLSRLNATCVEEG